MVNGTMTPFSGSGTFTASPAVNALFNNGTALAQTQTYSSSLTTEHAPGPGGFLGEIVGVEYDVAQVLGTLSRNSDSTLSLSLGTIRVSVKVVLAPVDPGSPEQVQFMFQIYDTAQSLVATATFNYNLTPTSVLSFAAAAAQNASGSLMVTAT